MSGYFDIPGVCKGGMWFEGLTKHRPLNLLNDRPVQKTVENIF